MTVARLTKRGPYADLCTLSQVTHDVELDRVRSLLLRMVDTFATIALSASTKRVTYYGIVHIASGETMALVSETQP